MSAADVGNSSPFTPGDPNGQPQPRVRFAFAMNQPGWVWRAAAAVVALIIVLPIAILIMLALAIGALVFGALAGASMLMQRLAGMFGGALPRRDGRENVRVIVRRTEV